MFIEIAGQYLPWRLHSQIILRGLLNIFLFSVSVCFKGFFLISRHDLNFVCFALVALYSTGLCIG